MYKGVENFELDESATWIIILFILGLNLSGHNNIDLNLLTYHQMVSYVFRGYFVLNYINQNIL